VSFFNKKEDVIDIELTQYGKYLLSKGKLKPAFYAFSDDEIVYDPSYNSSGSTEVRMETFERIARNNIRAKTFYESDSAEERVLKLNGHTFTTDKSSGRSTRSGRINKVPVDEIYGKDYVQDINMDPEKRSLFRNILGNANVGDQNSPAWKIKSLNNQIFKSPIELSSSGDTGLGAAALIPVIEIDIDYRTFIYSRENEEESGITQEYVTQQDPLGKVVDYIDKQILIDDQKVLLDISEGNVPYRNENFDLEFYIVEEKSEEVQDASGGLIRESRESLRRLEFAPLGRRFSDDPKYVETYFDIEFDGEISEEQFNDKGTDNILKPGVLQPYGPFGENYVGNLYDDDAEDEGCD
jgi:hypothetical protein